MGKKDKNKKSGRTSEATTNPNENAGQSDGKYSRRKVETNWAKYEDLDKLDDADTPKGLDFGQFSDASNNDSTVGSHFRFAQEKEWSEVSSRVSDYFKLDLAELTCQILSIPFHQRLRLDEQLFHPQLLEEFQREAKMKEEQIKYKLNVNWNQEKFQTSPKDNVLSHRDERDHIEEIDSLLDNIEAAEVPKNLNTWGDSGCSLNLNAVSEELDLILSMPSASGLAQDGSPKLDTNEVLGDDWLDSLLND